MANGGVIGKNNRPSAVSASGIWDINELYHNRLSKDWPGQLLVDVGSFDPINTTGTQTVNLNGGKTWTPKAILFFTAGSSTTSGTWYGRIHQIIGFTAGPTNSYAVSGASADNVATSDTARRVSAKAISLVDPAAAVGFECDLQSFNAGGFTLNYTTNAAWGDTQIMYVALGGDIQAEVLNWQTGTVSGNKSVSTGTFQPDTVFHAMATGQTAVPSGSAHHLFGWGAMNSVGEQWTVAIASEDNVVSSSDTYRYQRTSFCLAGVDINGGIDPQASYVSMNSNGFTVNFATAPSAASQVASLCIKGVKSSIFSYSKPTGTAPALNSVTAPGFQPALALTATYGLAASASPIAGAGLSIGAYDGTNARVAAQFDVDNISPTRADSIWVSGKLTLIPDGSTEASATSLADATPTAMTTVGWDETWNPNNTQPYQILGLALV